MTNKIALSALRIVEDWLAADTIGIFNKVNETYEFIKSSTVDEQYMLSVCIYQVFGQPEKTFQMPIYIWRPGCDATRVSRLMHLAGYANRITLDDNLVYIELFPMVRQKINIHTISCLEKVNVVINGLHGAALCSRLIKKHQINDIFCNLFYLEHAMMSVILNSLSTLPFHVSPTTKGLLNVDFRVNFVRLAWIIESRGYSVSYQYGVQECIIDKPGIYPECSTWTGQKSLLRNMPLFYFRRDFTPLHI